MSRANRPGRLPVVIAAWLAFSVFGGAAHALPDQFVQEGLVVDRDGRPLNGVHRFRVGLHTALRGGERVFDEVHDAVELFDGYYALFIGSIEPLDPMLFGRASLFLSISIDGGAELDPRTPLAQVPAAMVSDIAFNVVGDITPRTVAIEGVGLVIDQEGRWVGDPTGLRGPEGPVGPPGPAGPQGPAGAAGGDGSPDTPEQVRAKLVQVDGAGSGVDADLLDGLHANRFMRVDRDTGTAGSLSMGGTLSAPNIRLTGPRSVSDIVWPADGGSPDPRTSALALNNRNITGVNGMAFADPGPDGVLTWSGTEARIMVSKLDGSDTDGFLRLQNDGGISLESAVRVTGDLAMVTGADIRLADGDVSGVELLAFADPGPDGRIAWNGTQAEIFVAPLDGSNSDGWLRMVNDGGISLESDVRTTGDMAVSGRLGVGTSRPAAKLMVDDASAPETGVVVRNHRAGGDTRPFLRLDALTAGNQGVFGMIRALAGARAGGAEDANHGGLQFVVSTGGAATPNPAMTIQHDGDVGLGTEAPNAALHVARPSHVNAIFDQTRTRDHTTVVTGSDGSGLRYGDSNFFFIGTQPYADRADVGTGTERLRIDHDGNVGIGTTRPLQKLDVDGVIRGPAMTSNRTPQGFEHNLLFNAQLRFRVSQQGPARFDPVRLFDGRLEPDYPAAAPTPGDPQVVVIEGLPAHRVLSSGAWVGWTTRFWGARRWTMEGFDADTGLWTVFADYESTDYAGEDFMAKVPNGTYTSLRFIVYSGTGPGGRVGLSELFFIQPEITRPYEGLLIGAGDACVRPTIRPGEDIGAVLQPYVQAYDCVDLYLAANTTYPWETQIALGRRKDLRIFGSGWVERARNLTSVIEMNGSATAHYAGVEYRCSNRVGVGPYSSFQMSGVQVRERIADERPEYPLPVCQALFSVGNMASVELSQSRFEITEDLVNFQSHGFGRAQFGHTWVDLSDNSPRNVFMLKADRGWGFAGHGGVAGISYTHLGEGVSFEQTDRIEYLR